MPFTKESFIIILLLKVINSFFVLPFETIYVKDNTIRIQDYYSILFQNELYCNLSIGNPIQNIKSLLKMDLSGFNIYQGAFNHNLSTTSKTGIWDLNLDRIWHSLSYPVKDYFYFYNFYSYAHLSSYLKNENMKQNNSFIIKKTEKTSFIVMKNAPSYSNRNYYYFGIIGLRLNEHSRLDGPEFVSTFKNILNSYTFSFKFNKNNYTYNNYFNNINNGYFIVGEELIDDEMEKDKIVYTNAQKNEKGLSWCIYFDNIYTKTKDKKYINFNTKKLGAEFVLNLPYHIGTNDYLDYINRTFFNELVNEELCYFNKNESNKKNLFSFICISKSKKLKDYINNKFPDLIFEHKELGEKFILNKNDLFSFNNFNKSDTNIYFLIMFRPDNKYNWTLGISFLKKYRLSFNYETKKIGYYKEEKNMSITYKGNEGSFLNKFIKIIFITILFIIIFILGMLYQKKIIKIHRKNKANELDDNYEYDSYKIMRNKDINDNENDNNNNKYKKEIELGLQYI